MDLRPTGFARALLTPLTLDQTGDVYRLKAIGAGVDERPKGRERFPDDYVVLFEAEPVGVYHDRRPTEGPQGTQVRVIGEWRLHFGAEKDVEAKDVVRVTSLNSRVFNIIGPLSGSDELTRIFEASEIV